MIIKRKLSPLLKKEQKWMEQENFFEQKTIVTKIEVY